MPLHILTDRTIPSTRAVVAQFNSTIVFCLDIPITGVIFTNGHIFNNYKKTRYVMTELELYYSYG